jgi:multidrug resistance efflux pump
MQEIKAPFTTDLKGPSRSLLSNLLILAASAGLVVWAILFIQARLTSVSSVEAVINGVVTDIKAPQKGNVIDLGIKTGDAITQGQPLLKLHNDRVSKLSVEQLTGRLKDLESQLKESQASLDSLLSMRDSLITDRQVRTQFDSQEAQTSLDQAEAELKQETALYELAKTNRGRLTQLWNERAIARLDLDRYAAEVEQRAARLKALNSRIAELQSSLQASQLGYRPLSNSYDPLARQQDIELRILEQQRIIQVLNQNIRSTQAELASAQVDVQRSQSVTITAPTNGVVWRLTAQPNKFAQEGDALGQVLDCQQRWVDVFVEEQSLRSLKPGTPATIELYGAQAEPLKGRVSLVRSGVGRLAAGEDVAVPTSPNLPRNTQVRVDIDPGAKNNAGTFCYVGYTGKVTFQIQ